MKRYLILGFAIIFIGFNFVYAQIDKTDLTGNVTHFYQSALMIRGEKTVYFDPLNIPTESHDADIIFITHTHGDHFSIPDIKKVMKAEAILVVTVDGVQSAKEAGIKNVVSVVPNQEYQVAGFSFSTVPAYNTNKAFHPKENSWVGYIVTLKKITYYIAGDTDLIPEMKNIKADVVFLPVGGTYTMTAKEAADAANLMKPAVAVPIHFADIVGTTQDAEAFLVNLNKNIQGLNLRFPH